MLVKRAPDYRPSVTARSVELSLVRAQMVCIGFSRLRGLHQNQDDLTIWAQAVT